MLLGKKISILAVLVVLALVRLVSASGLAADINGDEIVNTDDLVVFAASWLDYACVTPGWCGGADLNKDGDVDYLDYAVISDQWLDEDDPALAFITTWYTGLGDGTTVTLGLAGTVNAQIDWGDGTIQTVTTAGPHVHDYGTDGIYTVKVTGSATDYNSYNYGGSSSERAKLLTVENWGRLGFTSLYGAFGDAVNLIYVPNNSIGIEAVTDMRYMFSHASSFNSDISQWDTSNVAYMNGMFNNASSFSSDIGNWNTSRVMDMSDMFHRASSFSSDISSWNTSNVRYMSYMFCGASSFNSDISGWNTSNVTNMRSMFWQAYSFNSDISGWDTSNVVNMEVMFYEASLFNSDISGWDTSNVVNMRGMFCNAHSFNSDISQWDTSSVTDMSYMFYGASWFNSDISGWDTSNVVNMEVMFYEASLFNSDISGWDTSNVTNMSWMFCRAYSFNSDISQWDTSNVTDMYHMFYNASSFNNDLSGWCVYKIPAKPEYFDTGASSWVLPRPIWGSCSDSFITVWDTSLGAGTTVTLALAGTVNAQIDWGDGSIQTVATAGPHTHDYGTDGIYTVLVTGSATAYDSYNYGGSSSEIAKLIRVQSWGRLGFRRLESAFDSAVNLVSVPNNSIGIEAVTNMNYMFYGASSFNQALDNWDTLNVTNMSFMFKFASAFNGDISTWNTSKVTNMQEMFSSAPSFNKNIGNWDTSKVTNMNYMFYFASAFNQDLSDWCVSKIPSKPTGFDIAASAWTLPRPVWGSCPAAFITTWDTSLGAGTTVTLALAGGVNAEINWGDGTIQTVTTKGPHTHDYGTDGIYTVMVTGSVTAYKTYYNGGAESERAKLISVENWGQLGFTSLFAAFHTAVNLVSVPNNSVGIEAVTSMAMMFWVASSFNSDISNWNTSNVSSMWAMFWAASSFNSDISNWNTSNVRNMGSMFHNAYIFNSDISKWDTSNVTDIWGIFSGASSFNSNISNWNTSNVRSMGFMFRNASSFNQDISDWDTSNVTNMSHMFYFATSFNSDVSKWDTSSVTDMYGMFYSASSFNSNISNWDTSNVTDMEVMFTGASSFNQDLSGWCVSKIPSRPRSFDYAATSWTLPKPIWGTCP